MSKSIQEQPKCESAQKYKKELVFWVFNVVRYRYLCLKFNEEMQTQMLNGLTSKKENAGEFTLEEALQICHQANWNRAYKDSIIFEQFSCILVMIPILKGE